MDERNIVVMKNITVQFPGVKALDDVSFSLRRGEVHVLLGENGAGKSTLVKVLSGVYKRNSGEVYVDGKAVEFRTTKEAQEAGVNIVHQELNLIPYLSVAENIFLGHEPKKNGVIDWKRMYSDTEEVLKNLGVDIPARAEIRSLSVAQQQMVEIAKAVRLESKVIVLDEPTSSLTDKEIESLFRIMRDLRDKGVGIIYISHRFDEIKRICDRATIMRDGKYVATVDVDSCDTDEMIRMMVGRELTDMYPKEKADIGEVVFEAKSFSTEEKLKNCSLYVRKGEILGLAGLMGAGRTEFARAMIGADPILSGEIILNGEKLRIRRPEDAVKRGIGLVPEDRKQQGLILGMSVGKNITLANLKKVMSSGIVRDKAEQKIGEKYIKDLNIRTPGLSQRVKFLSGGNQQKVVVAKWLMAEGNVLIFDEPTRGIDVGAKAEIYRIMSSLAQQGMAIIMISSELPEILGMSDRINVMCNGEVRADIPREEATQEKIIYYATGGK